MKRMVMILLGLILTMGVVAGCGGSGDSAEFDYDRDITIISREDGSGTRGAFVELVGIEEKDADGNKTDKTTDEANIVSKTGIVLTNVAEDNYAIGYISLGSLNDSVKALSINGVEANKKNIVSGGYKIARPFNIATREERSEATQDFIKYILSAEGQEIAENEGYIKINADALAYEASNMSGKVVVAGSSSVSPVMEKLAEAYMELNKDVTIEIQTSDSTTGMQNAMDGTCDIGMASRDLKDSEKAELTNIEIALDGIAVVVHPGNPVEDITMDQVKGIYVGDILDWSDFE